MRRTITNERVQFDLLPYRTLARREVEILDRAAQRYGQYLRLEARPALA